MTVCIYSISAYRPPFSYAVGNQSKHQVETISQLRQEARQWKDQCLRLEESSRREAQDWKEQFLRVEQERRNLLSRIDELVAEKLAVRTFLFRCLHRIKFTMFAVLRSGTHGPDVLYTES